MGHIHCVPYFSHLGVMGHNAHPGTLIKQNQYEADVGTCFLVFVWVKSQVPVVLYINLCNLRKE